MSEVVKIPSISVHPNYIAVTERIEFLGARHARPEKCLDNLRRNYHANKISEQTAHKIKQAVNYLCAISKPKNNYTKLNFNQSNYNITFVTLTLSAAQFHSDNWIKKNMLNQFLIEAKKHWEITNYVWRQEKQANGNIHFHIVTDRFIPWMELRAVWNRLQQKTGYIDKYRDEQNQWHSKGFKVRNELLDKWSLKNQLKAYKQGIATNWSNPNSTDIHGIKLINNLPSYICKYLSKEEKENHIKVSAKSINYTKKFIKNTHSLSVNCLKELQKIAEVGRLWSCSYQLTNLTGGRDDIDSTINDELQFLNNCKDVHIIRDQYFSIFCIDFRRLPYLKCHKLYSLLQQFLSDRFLINSC